MSENTWTEMDEAIDDNRRGYAEQRQWLQGKSIPEAEQALRARRATLEPSSYNDGGDAATADYIKRMRRYIADCQEGQQR